MIGMKRVFVAIAGVAFFVAGFGLAHQLTPSNKRTFTSTITTIWQTPKENMPELTPPASTPQATDHATILIPKIHVRLRVGSNVDLGPAFWPITGRPGGGDTIAIAGHRQTHTHPFLLLNELKAGDKIYLRYQGKWYAYVVQGWQILPATDLHIADAVGHERLLLTACSQTNGLPTDANYRIVVSARPA